MGLFYDSGAPQTGRMSQICDVHLLALAARTEDMLV